LDTADSAIVEAIFDARQPPAMPLVVLMRPLAAGWAKTPVSPQRFPMVSSKQ